VRQRLQVERDLTPEEEEVLLHAAIAVPIPFAGGGVAEAAFGDLTLLTGAERLRAKLRDGDAVDEAVARREAHRGGREPPEDSRPA